MIRFVIGASAILTSAFAASVVLAGPAWADIIDPPTGTHLETATPTITGQAPAGHAIQVTVENMITHALPGGCTATVPADGQWSCVVGPALPNGRYRITAADVSSPGTPVSEVSSVSIAVHQLATTPAGYPLPYLFTGLVLVLAGAALVIDAMRPVRAPVVAIPSRHRASSRAFRSSALDVARRGADAPSLQQLRRIYRGSR